ncbi:MAG: energy-coupling factor transporter transmembrane protein EcfT [Candidatus Desulfofervidaceae bacterium]|nr:energy-coupling factor transporter transmembrane protein EcfT [Candidatus Desulfofervidaceae bacterium]
MERIRKIIQAEIKPSWFSQLDPRTKMAFLASTVLLSISLDRPLSLAILFLSILFLYLLARLSLIQLKLACLFIVLSLWTTIFSQALFYQAFPRTIMLTLLPADFPVLGKLTGGIYIYREGLTYGLIQGLRLTSNLALGLLVCFTTEARDVLLALTALKVPYSLAFMVMTALRFIPILTEEFMNVIMAQRIKGFEPFKFRHLPKMVFFTLTPVLANTLRRSYTLAAAAYSRGFSPTTQRSSWQRLAFKWSDKIGIALVLTLSIFVALVKFIYFLYAQDIFYHPGWQCFYALGSKL